MPPVPPPESFDSCLDDSLPRTERYRRRNIRRTLYGMAMSDAFERRLTGRQRRRLIRYGVQLGLDRFEAALLISGAQTRVLAPEHRQPPGSDAIRPSLLLPASTAVPDLCWTASIGLLWVAALCAARCLRD